MKKGAPLDRLSLAIRYGQRGRQLVVTSTVSVPTTLCYQEFAACDTSSSALPYL